MNMPRARVARRAAWHAALLLATLALAACTRQQQPTTSTVTMPVRRGSLTQSVSGSGQIQALRDSALTFVTSGTVASVAAVLGQQVKQGDVLASLDTADLEQQVLQAQADLKSAQANLAELQAGPDAAERLAAEAQVRTAQIELERTRSGNATASSVASARAQLRAAQVALEALKNPTEAARRDAEGQVASAQVSLDATRTRASAAKTQAELALQQATSSLTQAQVAYATAKSNWDFVQETGQDPTNPNTTNAQGQRVPNRVSDTQRQQYYDAFVRAEASLRSAEASVQSALVSYNSARDQEVTDIAAAEQQLAAAQRQLEALLNPTARDIASAEAQVLQAQAQLNDLTGGGTRSDIEIAEMTLAQRQAELEALTQPPSAAELAQAEAAVAQAEAALAQAQRNLQEARLVAPFDATVAAVNITPGETTGGGTGAADATTAAVFLIDTASFYVDVNISEVDLARVAEGQAAQVTVDALPGAELRGTLEYVALTPTVEQNVTTYAARVVLEPNEQPLRVGMSAVVTIQVAEREDVLLAPNIAIEQGPRGPQVVVRRGGQDIPTPIETGLAGDSQTEVLSGLQEGDELVITVTGGGGGGPVIIPGPGPGGPGGPGGGGRQGGG